ncbi:MAG: hypothetical protein KAG53_06855 [Endozoicomonadaceae bacterium]|nr:hypothetical protein [Endozoicomonadaceae bacterium]
MKITSFLDFDDIRKKYHWDSSSCCKFSKVAENSNRGYEGEISRIEYNDFSDRERSFVEGAWLSDGKPKRSDLAGAGFFYTGNKDVVYCFFCGGDLNEWKPDDNPYADHRDHYSHCGYIQSSNFLKMEDQYLQSKRRDACSVSAEDLTRTSAISMKKFGYSDSDILEAMEAMSIYDPGNLDNIEAMVTYVIEKNSTKTKEETSATSQAQVIVSKPVSRCRPAKMPKHPCYNLLDARKETFDNWPRNNVPIADFLAEAGLWYVGDKDCVCCFSCGGGLSDWTLEHNPFIQHRASYPNCAYINSDEACQLEKRCNENTGSLVTSDSRLKTDPRLKKDEIRFFCSSSDEESL